MKYAASSTTRYCSVDYVMDTSRPIVAFIFLKLRYRRLVTTQPHNCSFLIHYTHRDFELLVDPVRLYIPESTKTWLCCGGCTKPFLSPSCMSRTGAQNLTAEVHEQLGWHALTSSSQCDEACLYPLWSERNRMHLSVPLYPKDCVTHGPILFAACWSGQLPGRHA